MKNVIINNKSKPTAFPIQAGYCESFLCRFRGLMFRRNLPPNWGLLLVQQRDSRLDSAIHMMGMKFDLAIVWINSSGKVVDVRPAYRWRSVIVPQAPAKYRKYRQHHRLQQSDTQRRGRSNPVGGCAFHHALSHLALLWTHNQTHIP